MSDSFIQVQPDSSGKQVDAELVQTTAGSAIYTQRARFVGTAQDVLDQIYFLALQKVTLLRMINSSLSVSMATEDDFKDPFGSIEDDWLSTAQDG